MPQPPELVFHRGIFQQDHPVDAEQSPLSENTVALLDHVKTAARLRYGETAATEVLKQRRILVELPEGYGVDAICIFGEETTTYKPIIIEIFRPSGPSGLSIKFKHPESCRYDKTVINLTQPHPAIRPFPYDGTYHADFRFVSKPPDRCSQGGDLELMFSPTIENASQIVNDTETRWTVQSGVIIGTTESLRAQLCGKYSFQDDSFHPPVDFLYVTRVSSQTP